MSLFGRLLSKIDRDPIILSHHPLCGKFDDHLFKIRGRYVCIGCSTVYPSALVSALSLVVLGVSSFAFALAIALAFFAANTIRFAVKDHRYSVLFNISLGVSLGAALTTVVYAPESLRLAVIIAGLAVAIVFSYAKGHRVFATCKKCERYSEFPACVLRPSDREENLHAVRMAGEARSD